MKKIYLLSVAFTGLCIGMATVASAQGVSVNSSGAPPDNSAGLDVSFTNKGILFPRLTTSQRNAIQNPANGLVIFNSDCQNFDVYKTDGWHTMDSAIVPASAGTISGSSIACQGQNSVSYSVPQIANATSYTWTYSGSGASISGSTDTISINFSDAATSGNLSVAGTNACGSGASSAAFSITMNSAPASPSAGNNTAAQTQVIWQWNTASGATGYKYGTGSDYNSAADNGTNTSFTQTGLTCNTAYTLYVWAYNACGNSAPVTLTQSTASCWSCGNQITDSRDGQMYNTVQIGTECWMAQNLNYGTYENVQTPNGTQAAGYKFCSDVGGGEDATCPMGGLYTWTNMMSGSSTCNGTGSGQPACSAPVQGICPTGWHIPSHYEWTYLETQVGSDPSAFPYDQSTFGFLGVNEGANLKASGTSEWEGGNTGTDASGFDAFGGGYSSNGGIGWCPYRAFYWTSTLYSTSTPIFHDLYYGSNQAERNYSGYDGSINLSGMSVRCVQN